MLFQEPFYPLHHMFESAEVNVVQEVRLVLVGRVHSVQSSQYIPPYFHAHLPKILLGATSLSRLKLPSFPFIYGVVADLIDLPRISTKLVARNLTLWASLAAYPMQGRMFSIVRNPGRQDGKTKACFTIRTIHNHAFMGNIVQRCENKIKDSPQRIRIDLPLGFIGPA